MPSSLVSECHLYPTPLHHIQSSCNNDHVFVFKLTQKQHIYWADGISLCYCIKTKRICSNETMHLWFVPVTCLHHLIMILLCFIFFVGWPVQSTSPRLHLHLLFMPPSVSKGSQIQMRKKSEYQEKNPMSQIEINWIQPTYKGRGWGCEHKPNLVRYHTHPFTHTIQQDITLVNRQELNSFC